MKDPLNSSLTLRTITDGWATDDLVYKWKDVDPVQIVPGLHLPRFTLEKYVSDYCNIKTNTGTTAQPQTSRTSLVFR